MMTTFLSLYLSLTPTAEACGGFFCNGYDPIEQAGEVVVFEVDEDAQETTMHVQVDYTGPAEQFAWVVPVPANPDTFITSERLFTELDRVTQPVFQLLVDDDECDHDDTDTDADTDTDSDADTDTDLDTGVVWEGVEVVSTGRVGPYDQAVLRANDADVLVDWLQANGYAVPAELSPLLQPYVGAETHFLALKLTKGEDTGALSPLGLTYAGTTPGIPIGLTAVAATDDMPVRVYLMGARRGVPTNYLHVRLNPLWLPWERWYDTTAYDEVVGWAVDEAGGRAFVTSFASATPKVTIYRDGDFDLEGLDQLTDPVAWFESLGSRGFDGTDELLDVLLAILPPPAGVDAASFYNCPSCYQDDWDELAVTFDPVAATLALDEAIVQPRALAQDILDRNAMVTRLDTLMSPHEMTVDPQFGFAPDMVEVPQTYTAELTIDCVDGDYDGAARRILLPTGQELPLASYDMAPPLEEELRALSDHVALVVEQLGTDGGSEVVADYSSELDALGASTTTNAFGQPIQPGTETSDVSSAGGKGCGCAAAPSSLTWAVWLPLVGLVFGRRRA